MTPPASLRRHPAAFLAAACLAFLAGLVLVAGDGLGQGTKKDIKDKKEVKDKKDEKKETTKEKKEEKKEPPKEVKKEPPKDKTPPLLVLKGNTDWVNSVAFSPDGKWLVTAGRDRTVRLWDAQSGKEVRAFGQLPKVEKKGPAPKEEKKEEKKLSPQAGPTNVRDAQFSPDGSKVASTTGQWNKEKKEWVGEVRLWEAQSGKELAVLHGHTDEIECVAFSADGKRLATGSKDMTAKVWDLAQAKDVQTLKGHTAAVLAVAFNKDGTRLATAGEDGTVRVWDVAGGKELTGDKGGLRLAGLADFTPAPPKDAKAPEPKDKKGQDKKGPPAKGKKGPEPKAAKEAPLPVTTVAYSRDGSKLAAASTGGVVLIWDAASGKDLQKIKGPEGVWSVAFSPDGTRLAEGGWSDLIKVWDVATGKELLQRNGHDRTVSCVAFSPDGQRLATAGIDGLVKVWPVTPKK
jgi:WD40 repeat protein